MLSALLGNDSKTRRLSAEGNAGWFPFGYAATSSGQVVNSETAPRVAAVYACGRVLSETFASAPCITYKKKKGGGKDRATNLGIYSVLHDRPNQWQTAFEFWEMVVIHLIYRGNFYAAIVPGIDGAVTELIPMNPDRAKIERISNGKLRYTFTDPTNGHKEVFAQDEIFHIRGQSLDGITGLSIIQYQKEVIGGAMAADKYASSFFANDATPGMVLATEQPLTPEARKETREQWERWHRGVDKAHRTAVLANGLKPVPVGVNNNDAQFLELRGYNDSKIASIFRVPPHLIGVMDRATFSNIEQQSLEFIMYTMLPWFRRVEAAIARDLLSDPNVTVEFLVDGLLRGDIVSRYTAYATGRTNGWLNGNEIRERENMNDMGEEGDVYFIQGAMMPLDRLINPPEPVVPVPPVIDPSEDAAKPADQDPPDDSAIGKSDTSETSGLSLEAITKALQSAADARVEAVEYKSAMAILQEQRQTERAREQAEAASRAAMQLESASKDEAVKSKAVAEELAESKLAAANLSQLADTATNDAKSLSHKFSQTITGIKKLAADELRGLIRVEINAMQRASHKHDFLSAIDKFYLDQRGRIAESMRHPLALLATVEESQHDPESLANDHCENSVNSLLEAAGRATADVLPETISALMADWEQRAAFLEN